MANQDIDMAIIAADVAQPAAPDNCDVARLIIARMVRQQRLSTLVDEMKKLADSITASSRIIVAAYRGISQKTADRAQSNESALDIMASPSTSMKGAEPHKLPIRSWPTASNAVVLRGAECSEDGVAGHSAHALTLDSLKQTKRLDMPNDNDVRAHCARDPDSKG